MIGRMKVRSVLLASVCTAWLVAGAAVSGASGAQKSSEVLIAEGAYRALVSGRSADAVSGFTEAIESRKLPPELLANALLNRALAHQNLAGHKDAIDDYTAALRVDALSGKLRAVALYNRGLSYQKLERPALAIEDFTSALFLDIEFAQAYYSRAEVLRRSGQYLFALNDYEQALNHGHPDAYLVHYGEALTYETLRRPMNAQQALARAISANPDFAPARARLAALGDADKYAERALAAPVPAPAQDQVMTGSLAGPGAELVVQKASLPAPESPPVEMLGYNDQVGAPEEAAPQPAAEAAVAEAEAAPAPAPAPEPQAVALVEPASEAVEPETAKAVEPDTAQAASEPETAEAAPNPETAPTKLSGWMVQLSSQSEAGAAWNVWKKLSVRHGQLLAGHEAAVVKADLGGKVYYRLRVHGLDSRDDARKLCARLKSRGTSCYFGPAAG